MNKETFFHPGSEYRSKPFWALNGDLEKGALIEEIDCMKKMGYGGAFLHSRTGLSTEYLSGEWMARMRDCAEALAARGMDAYLYDEDRWPSGSCGGLVAEDPACRLRSLTYRLAGEEIGEDALPIASFWVTFEGENRVSSYRPQTGESRRGERAVTYYEEPMPCNNEYNGYTYIDTMNRAATERFFRLTHEKYRAALGDLFGREIKGIFTDEPHRGAAFNGFGVTGKYKERRIPFTPALWEKFSARWGDDLKARLPELWFQAGDSEFSKLNWQYMEVVTSLFLENFAQPYRAWCDENKLDMTGHILHEDNLAAITSLCGSAMRFYEYMTVPGMDNLTAENYCYHVPKMVSSVARQCGTGEALTELYAGIGWQARFCDYKFVGDWQTFFGMTLRCPHLAWYTMKGAAKRDYPASLLHQAVWHEDYAYVEDYFARLTCFMRAGEREIRLLVVHPNESAWGLARSGAYENFFSATGAEYRRLEEIYRGVSEALLKDGTDFDYGDEEMMSRLARVERTDGGARFAVGKQRYTHVLVAGSVTLRKSTADLLNAFSAAGGRVAVYGDFPSFLEGDAHDFAAEWGNVRRIGSLSELQDCMKEQIPAASRALLADGTRCRALFSREAKEGETLLCAYLNPDIRKECAVDLVFEGERALTKWDARSGRTFPLACRYEEGKTVLPYVFAPGEELLLTAVCGRAAAAPAAEERIPVRLPDSFRYRLYEDNVVVLDRAEYAVDGSNRGTDEILRIDRTLRGAYGWNLRDGDMIQPWFAKKFGLEKNGRPFDLTLRFSFDAAYLPPALRLRMEQPGRFKIFLNGIAQEGPCLPSRIDRCFSELPLSGLRQGRNVLELKTRFDGGVELENLYLCGAFGVKTDGLISTLIPLPARLTAGDIVPQGFPFYAGRIDLEIPVSAGTYRVEAEASEAVLMHVKGREDRIAAFPPLSAEAEAEESLFAGFVFSQKNQFGPLHFFPPLPSFGAPGEFLTEGAQYSERFALVPQRIPPLRLWRTERLPRKTSG